MPLSQVHIKVFETIKVEWDQAEADIKLAEQVCSEIVVPAIKELRYGGRRLVDMIHSVLVDEDPKIIEGLLADATFDCHRARHDAIDAATAKISIDLDIMIRKLKYEAILPVYPEFPKLVAKLDGARGKIVQSRGNREDRAAIYAAIEVTDLPVLVKEYNDLRQNEPMMKAMAKRNRWRDALGFWGLIVGVVGIAFGVLVFIL